MELRAGKAGTALDAMRVKLTPSYDPSRTKLDGSRSGKSSALIKVSARTGRSPKGVMVNPVLSLFRLRYLVATLLSMALSAPCPAGEFADVAMTGSPGTETSANATFVLPVPLTLISNGFSSGSLLVIQTETP